MIMTRPTRVSAHAWMRAHDYQLIRTVQVRPDGQRWEPEIRRLAVLGTGRYRFTQSTAPTLWSELRLTSEHRVTEVTDDHLTVEWRHADTDELIHTATYSEVIL